MGFPWTNLRIIGRKSVMEIHILGTVLSFLLIERKRRPQSAKEIRRRNLSEGFAGTDMDGTHTKDDMRAVR